MFGYKRKTDHLKQANILRNGLNFPLLQPPDVGLGMFIRHDPMRIPSPQPEETTTPHEAEVPEPAQPTLVQMESLPECTLKS